MINWDRVNGLRDEIGAEDFAEVVALFLEETDEVAAKLPSCMEAAEQESALHFLKGSALNLGFGDLAQLCQEGERRAAAGDASLDAQAVIQCYEASKTAFEAGLDQATSTRAA